MPKLVGDEQVTAIRDVMPAIIAEVLKVGPEAIEVLIYDFGPLDIGIAPIGIDVLTGSGKDDDWRLKRRQELSLEIERRLIETGLIERAWIEQRSYVWLLVAGSSFVPIGAPQLKR